MATGVEGPSRAQVGVKTLRQDRWWLYPLQIGLILAFFVVYATVRIFMRDYYWAEEEHYLTPLYSPCISDSCVPGSSHFGTPLPEMPIFIPIAIITFVVLAGFRGTCYYYRKAGYRSFFLAPAACVVPEPHKAYSGEAKFPLLLLNYHRYFFYGALIFGLINVYDGVLAFHGTDGGIGMGLGTLIIWINLVMLWRVHAVVPRLPAHRRRATAQLLQASLAVPLLELGLTPERQARHVRDDLAGDGDPHRRLHHVRLRRLVRRPAVLLRRGTP